MKKIFKSILAVVLVGIISISLTGCGDKNNDDIINDALKEVQNANKNDNKDSKDSSNDYDNIKLFSDDSKIVFNMENVYYIIFYHNGSDITGMQYVYDYQDRETAKLYESTWRAAYEAEETVDKVELKGNQLVITFKASAYEGQTLESVKQSYSYLEELKKS